MQVRTGNVQNAAARYRRLPPEGGRTRHATGQYCGQVAGAGGFCGGNRRKPGGAGRLPIPDSREERRLRAMEQQLKAQQQELEQAKRRMIAMLA